MFPRATQEEATVLKTLVALLMNEATALEKGFGLMSQWLGLCIFVGLVVGFPLVKIASLE